MSPNVTFDGTYSDGPASVWLCTMQREESVASSTQGASATTSPALCPHWFYREKLSGVSKTGDIKVNVKKF